MDHPSTEWFFTAPLEETAMRRGDPLGMRAVAEELAEILAPGLSNRTVDARWLSILCWVLDQGHAAWRALVGPSGEAAVVGRQAAQDLYSWVRPLELLWIARTMQSTEDGGRGRQVPGVRSIRSWLEDKSQDRFGFGESSYRRYRFAGIYGGYRVALRSLPGLTVDGDGWRPGTLGRQLAEVVHAEVPSDRTHRRKKGKRPEPERYWVKKWRSWEESGADILPTVLREPRRVPTLERGLLKRALFSPKEGTERHQSAADRRLQVVRAAGDSKAQTRQELLGNVAEALRGTSAWPDLHILSPFCELADAGVGTMNACWEAVRSGASSGQGFASVTEVLDHTEVEQGLGSLVAAAKRWQKERRAASRLVRVADALAGAVLEARGDRRQQFAALERHHNTFGGGRKWLAIEDDLVKPLAPLRGVAASDYRFRMGALTRLAVQCDVIKSMPQALVGTEDLEAEDGNE